MTLQINPVIVAVVIVLLVLGLLAGVAMRQYSHLQFERRKRGKHLAELISNMVNSGSRGRSTSLTVEKKYVDYVLDELMLKLPTAGIELINAEIVICVGREVWSVPIGGYRK